MTNFGTMRPKLIAQIIIIAVMPSAIVALINSNVVCPPPAICIRPLATLKMLQRTAMVQVQSGGPPRCLRQKQ